MSVNVPLRSDIERVVFVTVDCLRWDFSEGYRDLYPPGVWYQATPQASFTPCSHTSLFTGLNPPRHGVIDFGITYDGRTLLTETDSVSASGISTGCLGTTVGLADAAVGQYPFPAQIGHECLQAGPVCEESVSDLVGRRDVTFLHDWIVHGTGPGHEEQWAETCNEKDSKVNYRRYRSMVGKSLRAHAGVLDELKAADLYENTLFVVWGDHGQSLFEKSFGTTMHGHYPEDSVARTPLGFLSPAFEDVRIDRQTNARSVDVVPTMYSLFEAANIEYDRLPHETEGVDLTDFEGSLLGYALSSVTPNTGADDGVKGPRYGYVINTTEHVTEYEPSLDQRVQRRHDADEYPDKAAEFRERYRCVRNNPTKLVRNSTS